MDGLYSDLERLTRINQLIDAVRPEHRSGSLARMRPIDTMLVVPSKDLRVIAQQHKQELPFALARFCCVASAGKRSSENRLLSFLLFEEKYTRELIELGYHDAMQVEDQLRDFVRGNDVPRLFAPDWIQRDLSAIGAH